MLGDQWWNGSCKYNSVLSFRTKLVNLKCYGGSRNFDTLCSGLRESFCKSTADKTGTVRPQYLVPQLVFHVTDIYNDNSLIFRYTDVLPLILGGHVLLHSFTQFF
jgi:hypothetical protein